MTKRLILIIVCALIISTVTACTKKPDPALAELQARMEAMQAELDKAKSGNASAEEIAKLETAIATANAAIAEQEQQAEQRTTAPDTTPSTTTTAPSTSTTTTAPTSTTTTTPTTATTPAASTTTVPASTGNTLVIPDGAAEIPRNSGYYWYSAYTSITIPGSVKIIPGGAFAANPQEPRTSTITSVTIGNGVTEIGSGAFGGQQLTSVTIPDSVTTIGAGAFANNKLTSVTLPNGITTIEGEPYGGVFYQNQITSVTIPDSVTTIKMFAFASNKITRLTLGRNVREIGDSAFDGHLLTGSLVIPNSVTTIGGAAFRGYQGNNVTSLTIGNRVTSIGSNAFCWLNLTSVTIPASVRTIEYHAFLQTNPISRVIFEGDNVALQSEKDYYEAHGQLNRGDDSVGPFDGNLHKVYNGRGTYLRGSNGQWTKRVETGDSIATNTNLHAEPSASARVIKPINAGQTVTVLNNTVGMGNSPVTATDSAGQSWTQVVYGGDEGWVRSDHLSGK